MHPQMNSPEACIQFKPDPIGEDGSVSMESSETFLRNYTTESRGF